MSLRNSPFLLAKRYIWTCKTVLFAMLFGMYHKSVNTQAFTEVCSFIVTLELYLHSAYQGGYQELENITHGSLFSHRFHSRKGAKDAKIPAECGP